MSAAATPSSPQATTQEVGQRAPWPKRVALAAAMGVAALNVWTGSPLFAIWVGARFQGEGPPKMATLFVVAAVLGAVSFALVKLLAIIGAAYEEAAGEVRTVRTHAPWLRSMRGEREHYAGERPRLTALERTLVVMVVVAIAVFEIWFFFFSGSPIDGRSGRSQTPVVPVEVAALAPALHPGGARTLIAARVAPDLRR